MIPPPPAVIDVCGAGCAVASLHDALARAAAGAHVIVHGGTWRGTEVLRRSVTLEGRDGATLDAGLGGSNLVVAAPHVRISGFTLRGAGDDPSGDAAAVNVKAPAAIVEDNRFTANAFAVNVGAAPHTQILRNIIAGLPGGSGRAGDAIRIWASADVVVRGNTISDGRDVLLSYSPRAAIVANHISGGRYCLHDMYSPRLLAANNVLERCAIGMNLMYADAPVVRGNTFRHNRGAAGYGLGLEGTTHARIERNAFVDNHVGLWESDAASDAGNRVEHNAFAFNGAGFAAPAVIAGTAVVANAFIENGEQVSASGGGRFGDVVWSAGGSGNYWSDYAGYDRDGDGVGDLAYAPRAAFDALSDAQPDLQLFAGAPATLALDLAARAFPVIALPPKLRDDAPLMALPAGAVGAVDAAAPERFGWWPVLAALALAPFARLLRLPRRRSGADATPRRDDVRCAHPPIARPAIEIRGLTKRFGAGRGVEGIDLRVEPGEAVALWGPNGAGKTTLLRCILGQLHHAGTVVVNGEPSGPRAAAVRRAFGYAPQKLPAFDGTGRELAQLVAALRNLSADAAESALSELEIDADKPIAALSGGMRQRLAIALALIPDAPILILDEPTAGLDLAGRKAVHAILARELRRGKTIVYTSHLFSDIENIADRVLLLDEGKVVGDTPARAFVEHELRERSVV
jgi:nitrous oxidase accessory protein